MAKISFVYPIEEIIGKLKGTFGASRHKAANAKGLRNQWTVNYGTRDLTNHPVSTAEITARSRFKAIQAMVSARRKDVSQRSADQAAFKAQSTYPTLTKYLWAVCIAAYDASSEH